MLFPLVASKESVFAYMQYLLNSEEKYKGFPAYIKHNFCLLRKQAEELARFHYMRDKVSNVTLSQVYDALAMTRELTDEEIREIKNLEKQAKAELGLIDEPLSVGNDSEFLVPWTDRFCEDFSVQLLAEASRRAVIENGLQGVKRLGALLGGPILTPYVEWFLQRSVSLGIKRLYFIARDGYILKRIADALIVKKNIDIATYYIHGSRRAWRMPSYNGMEGELGELVGWAYAQHIRSAEDLADVLQMPVELLRPYLVPEYAERGHKFVFEELAACVAVLDKSKDFRFLLKSILSSKKELVEDYLRQEVDTSDENFAFIELGGGGFTQVCLSRIMERFYRGPIRTFFFKMDRVRESDNKCIFYNFFPSKLRNDLILEMVCRAPEGQTEGYYRKKGKVLPQKNEDEAEQYRKKGYEKYICGIDAFIDVYAEFAAKFEPEPSLKVAMACMNYISTQDDNEITDFFAGLPNRVTGREINVSDFAPPITKQMLRDIFIRHEGSSAWTFYKGTDFDMSVKRSSPYVQHKAQKYMRDAVKIRNRWLRLFQPQESNGRLLHGVWQCPYSLLGKRVVLYGAGKRGRHWYQELSADKVIEVVQWLDKDYLRLKDELPVSGDVDSVGQVPFDWLLVDFADSEVLQSVIEELHEHGVASEKIYTRQRVADWVASWINYLHV